MKYWLVVCSAVVLAISIGVFYGGGDDLFPARQAKPTTPAPRPEAPVPTPIVTVQETAPTVSKMDLPVPAEVVAPSSNAGPSVSMGNQQALKPDADVMAKAAIQMDKASLMFRDFRTLMGSNPVGTNAEIMQAVSGDNPKKARLGPPEGQEINGRGELLDVWGTAYFFHQKSATDMDIHSAGPDKAFGTTDDMIGH